MSYNILSNLDYIEDSDECTLDHLFIKQLIKRTSVNEFLNSVELPEDTMNYLKVKYFDVWEDFEKIRNIEKNSYEAKIIN